MRAISKASAGSRAGLYYTCVNSFLTPDELAYILNNSESKILITSEAKRGVAMAALANCPNITLCLPGNADRRRVAWRRDALFLRYDRTTEGHIAAPADAAGIATPATHGFSR